MIIAEQNFNGMKDISTGDNFKSQMFDLKAKNSSSVPNHSFSKLLTSLKNKDLADDTLKADSAKDSLAKDDISRDKDSQVKNRDTDSVSNSSPVQKDDQKSFSDSVGHLEKDIQTVKKQIDDLSKQVQSQKGHHLQKKELKHLKDLLGNLEHSLQNLLSSFQMHHKISPEMIQNFTKDVKGFLNEIKNSSFAKNLSAYFSKDVKHFTQNLTQISENLKQFQNKFVLPLKDLDPSLEMDDSGKILKNHHDSKKSSVEIKDIPQDKLKTIKDANVQNTNPQLNQKETKGNVSEAKNLTVGVNHKTGVEGKSSHQGQGQSNSSSQQNSHSSGSQVSLNNIPLNLNGTSQLSSKTNSFSSLIKDRAALGRSILNELGENLKGHIGKKDSHFTIQLNPEALGKVKVILDMKDNVIKGQVVVENEQVKELLKERFSEMKTIFTKQGISFEGLDVQTQSEHSNQNSRQQQAQDLFDQYKMSTQESKINRYDNLKNRAIEYQKSIDTQYSSNENKSFTITI